MYACLGGFALASCNVYDASLVETNLDPGCTTGSRVAPPQPTEPDDPNDTVGTLVFALRDLVLDTSGLDQFDVPLWQTIGWNLDHHCSTTDNRPVQCVSPRPGSTTPVDGVDGIDNAFGEKLFSLVDLQYTVQIANDPMPYAANLQDYAAQVMADGISAMIVRIHGWNGLDNDSQVRVDVSQSVCGAPGTATTPPTTCVGDKPDWAGNDYFWLRDDAFVASDINTPRVFDDRAYVVDRKIYMRLPDRAELIFVGPSLGLRVALTGGLAAGRISDDRTRIEDLHFGGRWSKTDLLLTASSVNVCPGTPTYNTINMSIDGMLDVRSNADDDGQVDGAGNPLPCDALSMGALFQGYAANIGGLLPGPALPNPCMP